MPLMHCTGEDGKSGYKFGPEGMCYTHDGSAMSMMTAKKKALKQAIAIRMSQKRAGKPMSPISKK